jgi:hypothetical protein
MPDFEGKNDFFSEIKKKKKKKKKKLVSGTWRMQSV